MSTTNDVKFTTQREKQSTTQRENRDIKNTILHQEVSSERSWKDLYVQSRTVSMSRTVSILIDISI